MIIQTKERFEINEIIKNHEFVIEYLKNLKQEEPIDLRNKFILIFETVVNINEIAYDYFFKELSTNGFVVFLKVIDKFYINLNNHLNNNGKFDVKYLNLIEMAYTYSNYINIMKNDLKLLQQGIKNDDYELFRSPEYDCLDFGLNRKEFYDAVYNTSTNKYIFGYFNSFWLPSSLQKILFLITFFISILTNFPFSLNSLWSKLNIGSNYDLAVSNSSLYWPFNFWNINANWFFRSLLVSIVNFKNPVKSKTIYVKEQNRFKIDWKGNLLDLEKASKEEIDNFNNDEEKIRRDNATKIRYQSPENIRCRLSYLKDRKFSLDIDESTEKIISKNENLKLTVYSASKYNNLNENKISLETVDFDAKPSPDELQVSEETYLKTLVFSLHGGGFFTQRAENEELYTRNLIKELNGVPFLSVDYSLTRSFPKVTQEILDVYLWLVSGKKEVADVIGFNPEKIIITGDSAGAFLSFQLILVINDLNKILKTYDPKDDYFHKPILQVSSFVGLYPTFSLNCATPSRSIFKFDCLVSLNSTLIFLGKYFADCTTDEEFKNIEHTERYQEILEKNKNLEETCSLYEAKNSFSDKIKNFFKKIFFIKTIKPWYQCDYKTFKNRMDFIESFGLNAYVSPFLYKNYDDLKDISIYSIVGQFDAFLDENIELCKKWKGNIIIDVIDDLNHGFMYFCLMSKECKESLKIYSKRMQQACGLCK